MTEQETINKQINNIIKAFNYLKNQNVNKQSNLDKLKFKDFNEELRKLRNNKILNWDGETFSGTDLTIDNLTQLWKHYRFPNLDSILNSIKNTEEDPSSIPIPNRTITTQEIKDIAPNLDQYEIKEALRLAAEVIRFSGRNITFSPGSGEQGLEAININTAMKDLLKHYTNRLSELLNAKIIFS